MLNLLSWVRGAALTDPETEAVDGAMMRVRAEARALEHKYAEVHAAIARMDDCEHRPRKVEDSPARRQT